MALSFLAYYVSTSSVCCSQIGHLASHAKCIWHWLLLSCVFTFLIAAVSSVIRRHKQGVRGLDRPVSSQLAPHGL